MLSSLSPQHQPIVDGLAPGRVEDGDSELMPAARSDDNTDAQEDAPAAPDAADSTSRAHSTASDDSVEHDAEEEAERPRGLRDPGMPPVTEIASTTSHTSQLDHGASIASTAKVRTSIVSSS